MPTRYLAKPRLWWDADSAILERDSGTGGRIEVFESDEQFRATGLLDGEGRPLYRARTPIGFIHPKADK